MNVTIPFHQLPLDSGLSGSPGTSPEAMSLIERWEELTRDFENAQSLHGGPVRELEDSFLDGRDEGWDGYEALPVSDEAFLQARTFLNRALAQFPAPTASATPRGTLNFEWFVSPQRRFLVSIAADERMAYAGLFGADSIHGTATFAGDVPPEIVQHLRRLFYC